MARLTRMRLSGIRSFGCEEADEQEIKFSSPVTLFLGQNGCGKTTIIEALKYAITGDLPSGTKSGQGFIYDPQMAKKIESRGQVKLKLYDIKGVALTVTKVATVQQIKDKLKFKQLDSTLDRNHETVSGRHIDIHREICLSMGVPKAIVNSVIFCHQEDSHWPLEEPKKLKERFDAIFDSLRYNKCIENMLKFKKQKKEDLRLLAIKLDVAKTNKERMEKKRNQLREKEERLESLNDNIEQIQTKLDPVQKQLDNILVLEKEINNISTEAELIRNQLENINEQERDILSNCKEIDCTDKELAEKISSFESDLESIEGKISKYEKEIADIKIMESKCRQDINNNERKLGQLQAEDKQNKINVINRDELISQSISINELTLDSHEDTVKAIKTLDDYLQESEVNISAFDKSIEKKEKEFQDLIDTSRTKYVQLCHNIESKSKQLSEYKSEINNLSQKLSELDMCDNELKHLEELLSRKEKEISQTDSQVDIHDFKESIESEKKKYNDLEDQLQKIDNEVQTLQNYSSIQTELDVKKENLMKRQNDMQSLKFKHKNNFQTIFQTETPENNLKAALEVYLNKQIRQTKDITLKINEKQKVVTKLEINISNEKDKLESLEKQLLNDSKIIKEHFRNETYEKLETELNSSIQILHNNKATLSSGEYLYTKYITEFEKEKPCCPICMRDVKEREVVKKIISEIRKKISNIPDQLAKAEKEVKEMNQKYRKIVELQPKYVKVKELQNDVPTLKKKISDLEETLKERTSELKKFQAEVQILNQNQELANSLMSDVTLIDQYHKDIVKFESEIASLNSRMPRNESNRSMQDALNEQENIRMSFKATRLHIDSLTTKLTKHTDRMQALRDAKNNFTTKILAIKKDLQGKDQLANKQKEIENKIIVLETELLEARSEEHPMKTELDTLMKNKDKSKMKDKTTREKMFLKLNRSQKMLDEIINLQKSISDFLERNISEQIESINSSIEKNRKELDDYSKSKNETSISIDELKNQVNNRKNYYRELQDNVKLRKKRQQAAALNKELVKYEDKLGEHDITSIQRTKRKIEQKLSDYYIENSKLKGQIEEQKANVEEIKTELKTPEFANALTNFKSKFLEHKILEKAIEDIGDFAKAVDWAMLQYHKQQMVSINETIRDLWRSIYRGNDIDYIEIKTEMDMARRGDTRRTYNYRLVQVKNDVELEMRGRCSAGQKVLASLVIRIALADTFSTKCGILALDEPTTNLDKENITSLCGALCEIITRRRKQKNFQLIIITHDQEFLEKLGRTVEIDGYYLVSRSSQGKSRVEQKSYVY